MVVSFFTRMTRKGQITVPIEVRKALGLKEGDRLAVRVEESTGRATIERAGSVVDMTYGALKSEHRLSGEEERRLARDARAEYLGRKDAPVRP